MTSSSAPPSPAALLPEYSARTVLGRRGRGLLAASALLVAGLSVSFPQHFPPLVAMFSAWLYLISTVDRNILMLRGLRSSAMVSVSDADARCVPDAELPRYTVLLPVYDEPSIVRNLLNGVGKLDYPPDKLDVLLLVEEDDLPTQAALEPLSLSGIRVVVVPHSLPKTKPKACNYGMSLPGLDAEFLTLYDAEDIPEPLQLRRAVIAFRRASPDVACLQARLGYFNERQNLLTRWFSLEYDQWFGAVLPAVQQAGSVVPLGGTSCHFPVAVWREVGGWDAFNVTEDADLGVRLARFGYRTQILDSVTLEEANSDLINWIRQRSRWYKGYLQTLMVHLRSPLLLVRQIGVRPALRLANMTGAIPLTNALNIFLWSIMLTWVVGHPSGIATMFPPINYYLCLALFLVAVPLSIFVGLLAAVSLGKPHLWWAALLVPGYWVLQSIAAFKALYQLLFRPFYWEKTVHGLAVPELSTPAGGPR